MKLPIDVVPNSDPPVFRWSQTVGTLTTDATQDCEGMLPPSCERAVETLIRIAKDALRDNAMLSGQVEGLHKRAEQLDRESQQRVAAAAPLRPTATAPQQTHKK